MLYGRISKWIRDFFAVIPQNICGFFVEWTSKIHQLLWPSPLTVFCTICKLCLKRFKRRLTIKLRWFRHVLRFSHLVSRFIRWRVGLGRANASRALQFHRIPWFTKFFGLTEFFDFTILFDLERLLFSLDTLLGPFGLSAFYFQLPRSKMKLLAFAFLPRFSGHLPRMSSWACFCIRFGSFVTTTPWGRQLHFFHFGVFWWCEYQHPSSLFDFWTFGFHFHFRRQFLSTTKSSSLLGCSRCLCHMAYRE